MFNNQRGTYSLIVLVLIIGALSLGLVIMSFSAVFANKRKGQNAADAAVLAGLKVIDDLYQSSLVTLKAEQLQEVWQIVYNDAGSHSEWKNTATSSPYNFSLGLANSIYNNYSPGSYNDGSNPPYLDTVLINPWLKEKFKIPMTETLDKVVRDNRLYIRQKTEYFAVVNGAENENSDDIEIVFGDGRKPELAVRVKRKVLLHTPFDEYLDDSERIIKVFASGEYLIKDPPVSFDPYYINKIDL